MRYDESGEYDNEDAWVLGTLVIVLYLLGAAVVAFGWLLVLLVAATLVAIPLAITAYLRSEIHCYWQAQREIRQLTKRAKRRLRKLGR